MLKSSNSTHQMDDIDADFVRFHSFKGNQEDISRDISRTLIVNNFMAIRVLNIDSFAPNLCGL